MPGMPSLAGSRESNLTLGMAVKMIVEILVLLLVVFFGASVLLYLFQDRMIFFPQPTAPDITVRYQAQAIRFSRGAVTLSGWFFKNDIGPDRPLIVYYGGNAEDVALNIFDLKRFATDSFLFMNYRGYGGSQGRPSEQALVDDALFVLDRVLRDAAIDPAHVVLMGRSLGSGVAVQVAARQPVGGVILVTPFDSLVNVARAHYPVFPVGRLLRHRFESASLAPHIRVPALFLVAADDRVVPPRFAAALKAVWGGPARLVSLADTDHNTIETSPRYWETINAFLRAEGRR